MVVENGKIPLRRGLGKGLTVVYRKFASDSTVTAETEQAIIAYWDMIFGIERSSEILVRHISTVGNVYMYKEVKNYKRCMGYILRLPFR